MFNTSRSHKWIAPALVALAVGIYAWRFLPILNDDPYITARYARNLATGHGFVYNEGERVLGTTTPLTTLLLAGGMIALPDELALRLLSALFLGLTSALFLVFGRCFGRPLAGLAAGLLFPTIDWVARNHGGEFPLCVLLGLACATLVQRRHMALAGVDTAGHWAWLRTAPICSDRAVVMPVPTICRKKGLSKAAARFP